MLVVTDKVDELRYPPWELERRRWRRKGSLR
jgi:hypothetical protein